MTRYVALLRGINVGGKSMVAMAELRAFFEAAGFADVKTLLQSGNVIFSGDAADGDALERRLEAAAEKKFGRPIGFFVRDAAAWKKIIEANPLKEEARRDPSHLVVLCLKTNPKKEALAVLATAIPGREYFEAGERCLYLCYPDGIGRSKLTNSLIERKLGQSGTARNWNTVLKIAALMGPG